MGSEVADVTGSRTDAELAELDVPSLLRAGLGSSADGPRRALFGDGAVAGAILLDRAGVVPRSVAFLAQIVRSGGVAYAAELPEPLPQPAQTVVIRPWLATAASVTSDVEQVARWFEAVAAVLALRAGARHA